MLELDEVWPIFGVKYKNTNMDTLWTNLSGKKKKDENFDDMLSKRVSFGDRLSKIRCKLNGVIG